ncbi:MAG: hypothetical protein ACC628_23090 [Pirellulaceae bacterium]
METTTNGERIPAPSHGAFATGRRWVRFLAGLTVILLFAFVAIPGLQRIGPIRDVRDAIENRGIDATALFYTETEVASEAEASIRNAIRYAACRADIRSAPPR